MATPPVTRDGDRLTVQVEVTLGGSMLACEEAILDALNEAGAAATGEALERFDTDGFHRITKESMGDPPGGMFMTAYEFVEGVKVTFSYPQHELFIFNHRHHATLTG